MPESVSTDSYLSLRAKRANPKHHPLSRVASALRHFVHGNGNQNPWVNRYKEKTDVEVTDLNLDSRTEVTDYHARRLTAVSYDAGGNAHFNQPE